MENKKVLLVYYSRTGITEGIVNEIKSIINCDMERVKDERDRLGVINYIRAGREAMAGKLTVINNLKYNPSDYDVVVIATPVWAGHMAPAVRTYINKFRGSFKNCGFICTQGSSGGDKVIKEFEGLTGSISISSLIISGKDLNNKSYKSKLKNFISKL